MSIEAIIFLTILAIQFLLAVYAKVVRHRIDEKYNYPLSEEIEAATVLEQYSAIYRTVNIRVHAKIPIPAFAHNEFLLVNRDRIYDTDLFTNFFTVYQLELTRREHNMARRLHIGQNILFFLQLAFFIVGLAIQYDWAYILIFISVGIQVFLITFGFIGFFMYQLILNDAYQVALNLLQLDDVEQARAEQLKNDLAFQVLEYPLDFIVRVFLFLIPGK
jgi:hypothetical protein